MGKLEQIAKEVGVSPNTVLRVLRGQNKEVWPSAITRAAAIRDAARRVGYLPNGSARAVRRGRFDCVTLLLSADNGRSYLPNDLFNQIHDSLDDHGIRLVVSKLSDAQLTSSRVLPSILRDFSSDGLLINYTDHIPPDMVALIAQYEIPSIWMNSRQAADCVHYDDFGGAMAITEHLLSQGHRRIAYLDFVAPDDAKAIHYSRIDRAEGYAQAMRSAGVQPFARGCVAGIPVERRLQATRELLRAEDRPTAVIAYDAPERVLYASALEGLRVPEDLSLATFINKPAPAARRDRGEMFIGVAVTAMRVPAERAGARAVEMLLKKIEEPKRPLPPCVVPLELEVGDSTATAPNV